MNDFQNLEFTMRIDASDLRALMAGHEAAFHGTTGGSGGGDVGRMMPGGSSGAGSSPIAGGHTGSSTNPSFMSIFKPLASLTVIEKMLGGILKNSQILNTYESAMGKTFGAAIDLLLTPFIPLLNLIMVGVSKLVAWLVTSGTLETISKWVQRGTAAIESAVGWLGKIWSDIKNMNVGQLGKDLVTGAIGAATHPKSTLAGVGVGLGAWQLASMITPLPGPIGVLGKVLGMGARGIGGMIGMGGSGGGTVAGGGAAEAAAGAGGMGAMGLLGPAALGLGVGLGTSYVGSKIGIHGSTNRTLAMAAGGAAIGTVVPGLGTLAGAGIGAGVSIIGGKLGLFGSGKKTQQMAASSGVSIVNSQNTINATVNVTMQDKQAGRQVADTVLSEWQKKLGYQLSVRGA